MSRVVKIVSLVLGAVSFPLVLMMAMFSPALIGAGPQNMTVLQTLTGGTIVIVLLALPLWVLYFAWQTIRTWRSDSTFPALMTAVPACLTIAFFLIVNFVKLS